MNIKRALGFVAMLWATLYIFYLIVMQFAFFSDSLFNQAVAMGVAFIPVILIFAKWYFREVPPTAMNGLYLGLVTIVVGSILDLTLGYQILLALGIFTSEEFWALAKDWRIYIFLVEILALTSYAGYEFDSTYTVTK